MRDRNDEQQEELESESQKTDNDPVAFAEFLSRNGWEENQVGKYQLWQFPKHSKYKKNTVNLSENDLNGQIVKMKTQTEDLFAITDSGSPMSFSNEQTDRKLQVKGSNVQLHPTGRRR